VSRRRRCSTVYSTTAATAYTVTVHERVTCSAAEIVRQTMKCRPCTQTGHTSLYPEVGGWHSTHLSVGAAGSSCLKRAGVAGCFAAARRNCRLRDRIAGRSFGLPSATPAPAAASLAVACMRTACIQPLRLSQASAPCLCHVKGDADGTCLRNFSLDSCEEGIRRQRTP